jgi:hypothetical protein
MKILYIDMDNVLVDFQSGIDAISEHERLSYEGRLDEVPGIFSKMKPKEGAIEAFKKLSKNFDWLTWEDLTDESARLYSQLSIHRDIVNNLLKKWGGYKYN